MYTQIGTYTYSFVLWYSYTCTHIHPQHILNLDLHMLTNMLVCIYTYIYTHRVNLDAFFKYTYIYIYIYTTPWSTHISNSIYYKRSIVPLQVTSIINDREFSFLSFIISSSCSAISTDIPDPLSPPLPIVQCFQQVPRATPCILTKLVYVSSSWSPCFCMAMWRGP